MGLLIDKVAVITGGSRGLGLGIAEAFLQEKAAVVVASRSAQSVDESVAGLASGENQIAGTVCDVGDLAQVEALAEFAVERYGKIDIWINNAGISCPTGPTVHIPPAMVQALIQTNILGVYHGSIVAMRYFLAQNHGKLINMVGKGESKPVPLHNAYASSRAWVRNFTLAMAQEYKSTNVGVFLLNPGLVATDMLQQLHFMAGYEHNLKVLRVVQRLLADPPQVPAQKAVWLASAATDGKTGLCKNALGPGRMIKGLGQEIGRKMGMQKTAAYTPKIVLVEPAIDLELADNVALRSKREKNDEYLIAVTKKRLPEKIGNKAANLQRLMSKGYAVPETFVLTWDAYLDQALKRDSLLQEIRTELAKKLDPEALYAVRSSADVEDSPDYSFAGQFKTVLNVQGIEGVLEAVQEVWKAAGEDNVRFYQQRSQQEETSLRMAVIIQRMVTPVISGVSFSVNPITSLDEIVVEAVFGSGELLVQEGVTPLRWVSKWGNWIEKPQDNEAPKDVIEQVVEGTQKITKAMKLNVDLEWVFDGEQVYWLQMRDITAVAKADIYSNKIAKEMTPGLVKPLDWSVIVPIKSKMWINVISQVIGENDIEPESLAKTFHYRAYHNLSVFGRIFESLGLPRESLDVMMGVAPPDAGKPPFKPGPRFLLLTPRLARFLWDKWSYAEKAQRDYPLLAAEAKQYSLQPFPELDETDLIKQIDRLNDLNLRTTTHTFHAILLMQIYSAVLRRLLERVGVDFAEFDLSRDMPALAAYDPNNSLQALNQQFLELDKDVQDVILLGDYQAFQELDGIDAFRNNFLAFMEEFGHMSDRTGVFDTVPWRETPGLILELLGNFEPPPESTQQRKGFSEVKPPGIRGWFLKVVYNRARQFYLLREQYSSLYTYTLMLFRVYYLALGEWMVAQGVLGANDDVYYLYDEEIRSYIEDKGKGATFKTLVQKRKEEIEHCRDAITPEIIYGDKPPPVIVNQDRKLSGTPTSRGYYTGNTKLVYGISDFQKVDMGDVLVIPHSDVGWVPLFAKAGAVIAESGGMLSHSSIVAREYGIPAVVSVNGALNLRDNLVVSVDGYKGEVFVHDLEEVIS